MLHRILNLIFPNTCSVCKTLLQDGQKICEPCFGKIEWIKPPLCPFCSTPYEKTVPISHPCPSCSLEHPAFTWHRAALLYGEPADKLIYNFKYGSHLELTPLFAGWMVQENSDKLKDADFLVPVPMAPSRLKKRTYNQSLELAKAVSRMTGIPLLPHSLKKIRDTVSQTGLPRKERQVNLKGVFCWQDPQTNLKGKKVILVDDVYTTGSTLQYCARELKRQKTREIGALTVAFNPGMEKKPVS